MLARLMRHPLCAAVVHARTESFARCLSSKAPLFRRPQPVAPLPNAVHPCITCHSAARLRPGTTRLFSDGATVATNCHASELRKVLPPPPPPLSRTPNSLFSFAGRRRPAQGQATLGTKGNNFCARQGTFQSHHRVAGHSQRQQDNGNNHSFNKNAQNFLDANRV